MPKIKQINTIPFHNNDVYKNVNVKLIKNNNNHNKVGNTHTQPAGRLLGPILLSQSGRQVGVSFRILSYLSSSVLNSTQLLLALIQCLQCAYRRQESIP